MGSCCNGPLVGSAKAGCTDSANNTASRLWKCFMGFLSMRLAGTDYSGSVDFFILCRTMAALRIGPLKKQPALHFAKCRLLWAEPSADGAGFIQTRHRFHHRPEAVPGGGCAVQAGCSAAVRVPIPAACRRRFAVQAALNG